MRIPLDRIARLATEMLFHALEGQELAQREVIVTPELVTRESTAPPQPREEEACDAMDPSRR